MVAVLVALAGCGRETPESLMAQGRADLEANDARSAVVRFKSAVQAAPTLAEARLLLGQAMLRTSNPGDAVVELTKALDLGGDRNAVVPALARAMVLAGQGRKLVDGFGNTTLTDKQAQAALQTALGMAWLATPNLDKAQSLATAALETAAGYAPALVLQGRVASARGDVDGALGLAEKAIASDPKQPEAWQLKGELLLPRAGQTDAAEAAFQQVLNLERAYIPAHAALFGMRLSANDIAGAKKRLEAMREAAPSNPQTIFADAKLALVEQDDARLRQRVQVLLRGAPQHPGVLQLAGIMEARTGSLVIAETHFSKALQIEPALPYARTSLARVYLQQGQPARALETLQPLLEADPRDVEALSVAGDAALRLGNAADALALFERAASVKPNDPRLRSAAAAARLTQGDDPRAFEELRSIAGAVPDGYADLAMVSARLKRNDFPGALAAVDALVKKQPQSASGYMLRGQVLSLQREYGAARAAFEKALTLDPRQFAATANLAALDWIEKKPEQARARLEEAVQREPGNPHALLALAGASARSGAPYDTVRDLLARTIQAAPGDPQPRLMLIEAAIRARRHSEALDLSQQAAAALPNHPEILDALGRTQMQAGDTQQAISTFRRITGIESASARAHVRLADIHRTAGNRVAARASLIRALEIEPDLAPARTSLVELFVADGRTREAVSVALDMQRKSPQSAGGYLLEGAVHRRVKATDAAVTAYRNGLQRAKDPADLPTQLYRTLDAANRHDEAERFALAWLKDHPKDASLHYHLGVGLQLRGNLEGAQQHFSAAVDLRPNHPMALNNLAVVLTARGKPGAVALAQRAVDQMPNQPALMDTLAMALAAENEAPKGLELQKKAVELAPGDAGLRLNLARIAIRAGDKALARSELERLAAAGPKMPFQAEVADLLKTL